MMLFAAIYVPDFPVEAIVRTSPALRAWAVAVVEGAAPMRQVVAVNDAARAASVEPGMTELQARGRLGSLEVRQRAPLAEAAASAALLDCAAAISPRVELAADGLALADITGLERLFGPPAQVAQELLRRLREVGLEANLAISANLDAAIHAARGFSGVTVIPPGAEAERLAPLPVDVLVSENIAERSSAPETIRTERHPWARTRAAEVKRQRSRVEILETLDRWGVRTCRALAALPEVAVTERLGQQGLQLRRHARGEATRELVPSDAAARFEEALELEYPVADMEALAFLVNRLMEQLCARLAARALATNELRLRLELEDVPDIDCSRETINEVGKVSEVSDVSEVSEVGTQGPSTRAARSLGMTEEFGEQGTGDRGQEAACSASVSPAVAGASRPRSAPNVSEKPQGPSTRAARSLGMTDYETRPEGPAEGPFAKTYTITLPVPMLDARVFLKLVQLELRGAPPPAPVEKIFVAAEPVRSRFSQGGLFLPVAPEPQRLELTLARIGAVVRNGGGVGAAEVLDTHRPDAFAVRHFSAVAEETQGPSTRAPRSLGMTEGKKVSDVSEVSEVSEVGAQGPSTRAPRSLGMTARAGGQGTGDREQGDGCSAGVPPAVARASRPRSEHPHEVSAGPEGRQTVARTVRSGYGSQYDPRPEGPAESETQGPSTRAPRSLGMTEEIGEQGTGDRGRETAGSAGVSPAVARASRPRSLGITEEGVPRSQNAPQGRTALRLFRPPLEAEVATREGRPLRLRCEAVAGEILWAAGPWRASGEWWRDDAFARETFDIALGTGSAVSVYRVFCDTSNNRWFVEGAYD